MAGEAGMESEREEEVRTRLRGFVADLRAIRRRLAALQEDIPPSPQELSAEDLPAELDVPTEIRSVLQGAIATGLDPLIAALDRRGRVSAGVPD